MQQSPPVTSLRPPDAIANELPLLRISDSVCLHIENAYLICAMSLVPGGVKEALDNSHCPSVMKNEMSRGERLHSGAFCIALLEQRDTKL